MKQFSDFLNERGTLNENTKSPRGINILHAFQNSGITHDFRFTEFFYSGYNEKYRTHVFTVVDTDDEYWLATIAYVYTGRNGDQVAEFAAMPIEMGVDMPTAMSTARQHARTAAANMKR